MTKRARRYYGYSKLEMIDLNERLSVLCRNSTVASRAKKFIFDTHRVKWGSKIGKQIRLSNPDKKMTQVRSRKKAMKLVRLKHSCSTDDKYYDELVNFNASSAEIYLLAEEIMIDFGSKDYWHAFFPWVYPDMIGALTEILLEIEGEYTFTWRIYKKGHYVCGYTKEGGIFVL